MNLLYNQTNYFLTKILVPDGVRPYESLQGGHGHGGVFASVVAAVGGFQVWNL